MKFQMGIYEGNELVEDLGVIEKDSPREAESWCLEKLQEITGETEESMDAYYFG